MKEGGRGGGREGVVKQGERGEGEERKEGEGEEWLSKRERM